VALVGRVFIQEFKRTSYLSLRLPDPPPALIVVDEFATLGEASQLVDLLLQAREAKQTLVVSSQFLPSKAALQHAVLGAGLLVLHQIGSPEDSRTLARTIGQRPSLELSWQLGQAGTPPRRQLRLGQAPLVPPDELGRLPVGQAVVCSRYGDRRVAVVQIAPLSP
jgi:hypothetical protein